MQEYYLYWIIIVDFLSLAKFLVSLLFLWTHFRSTFLTSACIFFLGHEDYYDHTAQELYGPVVSKDF